MRKSSIAAFASAILVTVINGASAQQAPGPASVSPDAVEQIPHRILQVIGGLHCRATRADGPVTPVTAALSCELRLFGAPEQNARMFDGEIVGVALPLVDPGGTLALWNVYSATKELDPAALSGDYDIVSSLGFRLARERDGILFGGRGDAIALELAAPVAGTVTPSTFLKLTMR